MTAVPAWEPHRPRSPRPIRSIELSCCSAYEWCSEGGLYFVLRRAGDGYEETGRGIYARAREVWDELTEEHARRHRLAKSKDL
ncbi:hypothetical protein [Nonomuraea sp. NPDC049709]|uniref:hypothetical protein n=1 Tax=Nonomuraea sp. NPDC049709 TaxID=3154736 RepID=UPI0034456D2E